MFGMFRWLSERRDTAHLNPWKIQKIRRLFSRLVNFQKSFVTRQSTKTQRSISHTSLLLQNRPLFRCFRIKLWIIRRRVQITKVKRKKIKKRREQIQVHVKQVKHCYDDYQKKGNEMRNWTQTSRKNWVRKGFRRGSTNRTDYGLCSRPSHNYTPVHTDLKTEEKREEFANNTRVNKQRHAWRAQN